jgi:hypothetical protein
VAFFNSAPRQVREFSLAELVAKISQLERRQQGGGFSVQRSGETSSTHESSGGRDRRDDESHSEQELTE